MSAEVSGPQESDHIWLESNGLSGTISRLPFSSSQIHRYLSSVGEDGRGAAALNALRIGSEAMLMSMSDQELKSLTDAVRRLDTESARIVEETTGQIDSAIETAVKTILTSLEVADGPLGSLLAQFDPSSEGNVIDVFRGLVSAATRAATTEAVGELSDATQGTLEKLASAIANLERVVAVEQARQLEAARGSAKGIDHELATEALLGEFVAVTGDGLDDVSTVLGLQGTKKGDKIILPLGGVRICTEEKSTTRMTESKARKILGEAMANRGASLGMLIVDDQSKVPGNQPFHLIGDDMVVVAAERFALRLVYHFFRAKAVLLKRAAGLQPSKDVGIVVHELRELVSAIQRSLERFRLLRTEHTKALKAVDKAGDYLDEIGSGISEDVAGMVALIDEIAPPAELDEAS